MQVAADILWLLTTLQDGNRGLLFANVTAVHTRAPLHHTMPFHAAHLLLSLELWLVVHVLPRVYAEQVATHAEGLTQGV